MVCTSGHEPPNFICEAKDEWVVDELSHDGLHVYVDPDKVRAKIKVEEKKAFEMKIVRAKHWLEKSKPYFYGAMGLAIVLAVLKYAGHV